MRSMARQYIHTCGCSSKPPLKAPTHTSLINPPSLRYTTRRIPVIPQFRDTRVRIYTPRSRARIRRSRIRESGASSLSFISTVSLSSLLTLFRLVLSFLSLSLRDENAYVVNGERASTQLGVPAETGGFPSVSSSAGRYSGIDI